MGRSANVIYDGSTLRFLINFTDPSTGQPYSNADVTAVDARILDPSTTPATTLVDTTAMTWDSAAKVWKMNVTMASGGSPAIPRGTRVVVFEAIPTRNGPAPALWPEVRQPVDLFDAGLTWTTQEATTDFSNLSSQLTTHDTDIKARADTIDSEIATHDADMKARADTTDSQLSTHDADIKALLNDATYGLAALNADLDDILSRLGVTTDVNATDSAGTAMAKLNLIIDQVDSLGAAGLLKLNFG